MHIKRNSHTIQSKENQQYRLSTSIHSHIISKYWTGAHCRVNPRASRYYFMHIPFFSSKKRGLLNSPSGEYI
jgi:hypothetical protein